MSSAINEITLSGNADGGEYVVSSAHDLANVSIVELVDHVRSSVLQFVFEDDKSEKLELRLGVMARHFFDFGPIQRFNVLSRTGNDPKASMSIESQQLLVVYWDCRNEIRLMFKDPVL